MTKTKPQEMLEFNLAEPRETFLFDIPLLLECGEWILKLTSVETQISLLAKLKVITCLKCTKLKRRRLILHNHVFYSKIQN